MSVQVTRAVTASGATYEFLPDLSRVRRVSAQAPTTDQAESSFAELRRDDEWVRIVAHSGTKSPASMEEIRVGYPLIITLEALGDGPGTARHTTPVVEVTVHEMAVDEL